MARYMRSDLGRGHTLLRPPVVVAEPPPPSVKTTLEVEILAARLNALRLRARWVIGGLGRPVVIDGTPQGPPIRGFLFPISQTQTIIRREPSSRLSPPAVVGEPVVVEPVLYPIQVTLARIRPVKTHRSLPGPVVLDLTPQGPPTQGYLTPTSHVEIRLRTRQLKSRLGPPTVAAAGAARRDPLRPSLLSGVARCAD